jgi:hypothetical protein
MGFATGAGSRNTLLFSCIRGSVDYHLCVGFGLLRIGVSPDPSKMTLGSKLVVGGTCSCVLAAGLLVILPDFDPQRLPVEKFEVLVPDLIPGLDRNVEVFKLEASRRRMLKLTFQGTPALADFGPLVELRNTPDIKVLGEASGAVRVLVDEDKSKDFYSLVYGQIDSSSNIEKATLRVVVPSESKLPKGCALLLERPFMDVKSEYIYEGVLNSVRRTIRNIAIALILCGIGMILWGHFWREC